MTATEELRRLLDERGVEWRAYTDLTRGAMELFHSTYFETPNGYMVRVTSTSDSDLVLATFRTTPEQAIAATLGSDVKDCENLLWEFVGALDVADTTDADKRPIVSDYARHIAATLGRGECKVVASSTDGLTSDNPKQWFELSCGHAFKLYGLGAPVACPVCGKVVKHG